MFRNRHGLSSLLKDGGQHQEGTVVKNIQACKGLAAIVRTSLGPNSMNKLIINHLEKHFVTSDAALMMKELEVAHPSGKMLVMASEMQEQEYGDGTNACIIFAGELLSQADALMKEGLHTADIVKGFELAEEKAIELLNKCEAWKLTNPHDASQLQQAVRTSLTSKQLGYEASLCELVSQAASMTMPPSADRFTADSVRVAKLVGGALNQSHVVQGMVVTRDVAGPVHEKRNCKVLVLSCGLEMSSTETKGTVLLNSAAELMQFTQGEEEQMEALIKSIKDAGVEAIIVGGPVTDIALHFTNKYNMLVLKVQSKFELRRLCQTIGATALVRLGAPLPEEVGRVESICVEEIGSKKVTVVKAKDSRVATIVLRASTMNVLDEVERSIADAVSCLKSAVQSPEFVWGGGATEVSVSLKLQDFGATVSGLDQYCVMKYAESLEVIPKVLGENAGHDTMELMTQLYAAHKAGKETTGVDVESHGAHGHLTTLTTALDHRATKLSWVKLATDTALSILRVDELIMSRVAGGPKPRKLG
eukprot:GHVN01049094.1.p1 GENE.GHVN01049094.1~~GHVN01049094.1.p1  ORF type:complete len:533 (-),score=106.03 GHVN01049094.1:35-1633(-)